jgi:phosphoribosylformylglycinamidine synthase
MPPRVLILRAPGTNCDHETQFAFEQSGASAERVHVARILERPAVLEAYQILCIPGGFSYGDDIAAGRILAGQLRHHLSDALRAFRSAGKLILGICNGFQVLLRSGILLDEDSTGPVATLSWNDSGQFEDRWVCLRACSDKCPFLAGIDRLELPVAHAEGKFITRDRTVLLKLQDAGQLVLRYARDGRDARNSRNGRDAHDGRDGEGAQDAHDAHDGRDDNAAVPYPENPNGSIGDVAGVCDTSGRVLGMMPHPERHTDRTHHPRWTRGQDRGPVTDADGLAIFKNAVRYFEE